MVVATITHTSERRVWFGPATVKVERSLLGELEGEVDIARLEPLGAVGDKVLLALSKVDGAWVSQPDASGPWTLELEAQRVEDIARRPTWPEPVNGWSAVIVPTTRELGLGEELDAWVLYRNTGDSAQRFAYAEWPSEKHSYWDLRLVCDGEEVLPKAHPHLTEADITAYFAANGNAFEVEVAPGAVQGLPIQRLTSAKPGWGYKQRLGFRYWPLEQPGSCELSAVDVHGPTGEVLRMPAVPLTVRAAD